jgi:hypothetical protein
MVSLRPTAASAGLGAGAAAVFGDPFGAEGGFASA